LRQAHLEHHAPAEFTRGMRRTERPKSLRQSLQKLMDIPPILRTYGSSMVFPSLT
jgi:hypothetical protein